MHYVILGLAIDCALRLCFGGNFSVLSLIAQVLVAPLKPRFTPGISTQFAASVATMFSVTASALLFTGNEVAGAVVLVALV